MYQGCFKVTLIAVVVVKGGKCKQTSATNQTQESDGLRVRA
jgi:hypothetical protein